MVTSLHYLTPALGSLILAVLVGCGGVDSARTPDNASIETGKAAVEAELPATIRNMPMNDGETCLAIALTVEALLDAAPSDEVPTVSAPEIGQEIYLLPDQASLQLPQRIKIDSRSLPIDSRAAMDAIVEQVNALYQRDHLQLIEQGKEYDWLEAIPTLQDVNAMLLQDSDGIVVLCGHGQRRFADGHSQPSYHVFLLGRTSTGYFVIDPNDPGQKHACKLEVSPTGVVARWKCRLRDSGESTAQEYRLVRKDVLLDGLRKAIEKSPQPAAP